ncbi:hypothetical protein CR194_07660 [Salipaludibacillus keqinensis]|uniref:DUF2817 domain-containing protein n=1 Tax=Salipaludibacillus keqinensis TaxID=2045207 RepID=A0A323TUE8_9BACI|nr:M14 family metallopeptidase [Salipaludibacillus keqinensis]PYZ93065.1 hypothetical protein CR194_07660 [Salipaludibacillus keqinensis]
MSYFSETYEKSREKFRKQLNTIKAYWPNATLENYHIGSRDQDNTTDILLADAIEEKQHLITITSGEHGIEGYAGSAIMNVFIEKHLPYVNPRTTGIRLVHGVNPWGMRNWRRVSENNVDLNRNYIRDWTSVDTTATHDVHENMFAPTEPMKDLKMHNEKLSLKLATMFTMEELEQFKNTPEGQHAYPTSIFFGGEESDEPTVKFQNNYFEWIKEYDHLIHLDLHTGGGPKDELSLNFMEGDRRSEEELKKQIDHSPVEKVSTSVPGDSTQYFDEKLRKLYPNKQSTVCLFEFGTLEESIDGYVQCTQTMINENLLYFKGVEKKEDEQKIKKDFRLLFYPEDESWKQQVIDKGRKGLQAVLTSEQVLSDDAINEQ